MATNREVGKKAAAAPPAESPFVVIIDTREQCPYRFESIVADVREDPLRRPISIAYVRRFLPQGDYSIVGYESAVAVERKSIEDLFGTLAHGRRRFEDEMLRLQSEATFAAIVVEAEWSDILSSPPRFSKLNPKTVFRTALSWQQRFPRVHWLMMPGRTAGEIATYRILEKFWEKQQTRNETLKRKKGDDRLCLDGNTVTLHGSD